MTAITFAKASDVGGPFSTLPTVRSNTLSAAAAQTITATQLCAGYVWIGAAGGGGTTLTMPTGALLVAYLTSKGITPVAGRTFPPVLIAVTDANNLTLTPAAGFTLEGAANVIVNNTSAVLYCALDSATTAKGFLIKAT